VKNITLFALLFLSSALLWAGTGTNPADYTVNVHVGASRMVHYEEKSVAYSQVLNIVIDGKKYELESYGAVNALLAVGDYKAKLVRNDRHGTYDSFRVSEFLFPDQKTRKFIVVGQAE
jgi:hypothetical protein